MADKKISALTDGSTAEASDRIPVARDPDGTPLSRYITPAYLNTYIQGVAQTVSATRSFQANCLFSPAAAGGMVVDISDTIGLGSGQGTMHIRTANSTAGTVNAAGDELVLENNGNCGMTILASNAGSSSIYFGAPGDTDGGALQYTYGSGSPMMTMSAGGTERARHTPQGYWKFTNSTGGYLGSTSDYHEFRNPDNTSGDICLYVSNGGTNTENESSFLIAANSGAQDVFYVYGNGNCANAAGDFDIISDESFKANIVDAPREWDTLRKIKVREYDNLKANGARQIGPVGQEVEALNKGLTVRAKVDGEEKVIVKQTKIFWKAVHTLQEAQERIEDLEKKVALLEKRP